MHLRSKDVKSKNFINFENINEQSFEVRKVSGKNRALFNKMFIAKGDIVIEYVGELIKSSAVMKERVKIYIKESLGSYVLDFMFNNKKHFIDATKETKDKGRLMNHSICPNVKPFLKIINETPRIFLRL